MDHIGRAGSRPRGRQYYRLISAHDIVDEHRMFTPSWDRLRVIGNSRLIKLTIIMPLVGYLIIFNNHVVSALQLATSYFSSDIEHSFLGNINGEFLASRLRFLYFGFFLTGVGSSLFTLFCPQKVKQYADAVALAQRELAFLPMPHFYSLIGDLSRKRDPDYTDIDIDENVVAARAGLWQNISRTHCSRWPR
jgi:hypothetical protein